MPDLGLLPLLIVAIAIGWLLGRASRKSSHKSARSSGSLNRHYVKGLNYLLNDEPDGAIEALISSLEVNSETIETHLAIGNLSRRRGEVDRAIHVHQNLLARPSISHDQRQVVEYELALDYMAAGWLDRAERILCDLLADDIRDRDSVLRRLIDIYQQEHEWGQAIPLAKEVISRSGAKTAGINNSGTMAVSAAHYCCELAEQYLDESRVQDARATLKQAWQFDANSVRASLLVGRTELKLGNKRRAWNALKKIPDQDPKLITVALEDIRQAGEAKKEPRSIVRILQSCLERSSPNQLIMSIYDELLALDGREVALLFLQKQLELRPSIPALLKVVQAQTDFEVVVAPDIPSSSAEEEIVDVVVDAPKLEAVLNGGHTESFESVSQSLDRIRCLLESELESQPDYLCSQCGFSGHHMHWQCPSCKSWGQIKPL